MRNNDVDSLGFLGICALKFLGFETDEPAVKGYLTEFSGERGP
jgi:hypothetical protein